LYLPGLPFPLESSGTPVCDAVVGGGTLTLTSGPKSDMFIDPAGDEGARRLIGALNEGELVEVEASDMGVTFDVDTPEDLAAAQRLAGGEDSAH